MEGMKSKLSTLWIFATLNYLRSFPFNKIKIDRSFIHDVSKQHENLAIVRSVADLASELNIGSVAEGVETAEQLGYLRELGCAAAQGYYFSSPVDSEGARSLLERSASW